MRKAMLILAVTLAGWAAQQMPAPRLQALGTEPFWSIEIGNGQLRYSSPDVLDGIAFPADETPLGKGWRFSGTLQGKPVILVVEPAACNDGMSDMVYPYTARFTWGERTDQGCARRK